MHSHSPRYGRCAKLLHPLLLLLMGLALLSATAALAAPARQWQVLALGDSLTAGYQLPPAQSFPAQLQAALQARGMAVQVHNAGVSGDTTAQAKARLGWVLNSLPAKPDLAIVALGANDMLRGQPPAQAKANLDSILAEFDRRGIAVLLAGMRSAPNMGAAYAQKFDPIYADLAKKHGATLYPFFTEGVSGQPALLLADGMHPNAKGVAVMVRNIAPLVVRELRPR